MVHAPCCMHHTCSCLSLVLRMHACPPCTRVGCSTQPPAGRDLYIRNLSLLVPFLVEPVIELKSLRRLQDRPSQRWQWPVLLSGSRQSSGSSGSGSGSRGSGSRSSTRSGKSDAAAEGTQLFAEWRLTCYVRLPWAPYVEVNGTTTYTLNEAENQVGLPSVGAAAGHLQGGMRSACWACRGALWCGCSPGAGGR